MAAGQGITIKAEKENISGPGAGVDNAAWFAAMQQWRTQQKAAIGYDGAQYDRPELRWTQRSLSSRR